MTGMTLVWHKYDTGTVSYVLPIFNTALHLFDYYFFGYLA